MKSEQELQQFFHDSLMPELKQLESQRKVLVANIKRGVLIFVAGLLAGGGIFLINREWMGGAIVLAVLGLIAAVIYVWMQNSKLHDEWYSGFKHAVIGGLVEFLHEDLKYSPKRSIPVGRYMKSKIFLRQPDRYNGDDYVKGTIGETEIEFSELHSEYKTETRDSEGRRQTHWHTIFRGLFFVGEFNKEFQGHTVVLPDTAEKAFGWLGQKLQSWNFSRDELIKLEDPEFEREFVVYGKDQIEARYILSNSLMQRILQFKREAGRQIYLSFLNAEVYVAISYSKALFEPSMFGNMVNYDLIKDYYKDLELAVGIVEDLNLNTRIWSKD
jgi:hypothetical protein